MTMETRRQDQDVRVYQCDFTSEVARCVRETASFVSEGTVTVFLDAAWLSLRVGLAGEKHFCSWDHMAEWTQREHAQAIQNEGKSLEDDAPGSFAAQLRHAAQTRQEREEQEAQSLRSRLLVQQRSGELLGDI